MHMGHNSQGSICIILVFVLHASFGSLMICCSLSLQKQLYNRNWEEMPKKYVYPAGNITWCAPQFRISEGFAVCYRNSMDFIITFLIPRVTFTGSRTVPDTSFHFQSPSFNSKLTKESGLYMSLPQVAILVDILRINVFWYSPFQKRTKNRIGPDNLLMAFCVCVAYMAIFHLIILSIKQHSEGFWPSKVRRQHRNGSIPKGKQESIKLRITSNDIVI